MLAIGLTGGIGSGKTTVAKLFAEHQVPIIDADLIARELVEPGQPALQQLIDYFGDDILKPDGSLDRRKLRHIVFNDPEQRAELESILHPLIRSKMIERLDQVEGAYVILVIPLLVDTSNWNMIDRILVVDVNNELQLQRVMQRDGVDRKQAETIIDTQISRDDRLEAADDIIDNTGDITHLRKQVDALHQFYLLKSHEDSDSSTVHIKADAASNNDHLHYEYPLNERIRTFLRLEQLFMRADYHLQRNHQADAYSLITLLVDINNLLARGDIKSEIIKELERQYSLLKPHLETQTVNQAVLQRVLNNQSRCIAAIHEMQGKLGQHLQNDLLFTSVRQRLSISGGSCEFDLPIFNYWLKTDDGERKQTMYHWLQPFAALNDAIIVCLDCIRESSEPLQVVAESGYYEETLEQRTEPQLVRVAVHPGQRCYPTISANKRKLNIRFLQWLPNDARAPQVEEDIPFSLMICGI